MGAQNLAIVFAPNLFRADNMDPLVGLQFSQKVVAFVYRAIQWRAGAGAVV